MKEAEFHREPAKGEADEERGRGGDPGGAACGTREFIDASETSPETGQDVN